MTEPRVIAGLHCFEVLELLEAYLEEALSPEQRAQVQAHLAECAACAEFGGRYAQLVQTLHHALAPTSSAPHDQARALFRKRRGPTSSE